jgi:predicted CopG family antitoxin
MPILFVVFIVVVVVMTTIAVTDEVKEKLLKIASELQIKLGRRVSFDEALEYLLNEREKKPRLLEEAGKPTPEGEEALEELYRKRGLDEKRLERKVGGGRKLAVVASEDLAAMLKESGLDVGSISLEKAIKGYEKARELEWKRLSSTQTHS